MKSGKSDYGRVSVDVASFLEAWIEINIRNNVFHTVFVASFMEAWIEIGFLHSLQIIISSLIVLLLSSCSCVNIKPRRRQVKTAPVLYFLASVLFLR